MKVSFKNGAFLACIVLLFLARNAYAEGTDDGLKFTVIPGESRVISHGSSASRDTGILAYQVLPRVALSTGGDFAFFGLAGEHVEARLGMFGLIEVQTRDPDPVNFFTLPRGPYLWRGLLGYSVALASETLAERLLGPKSALELAVSFRHESEHYTGSYDDIGYEFVGVPHIGDFFMPDLALRKGIGCVVFEARVQGKIFLPTSAYSFGPGMDLILIWEALEWAHPMISVFGEHLWIREHTDVDTGVTVPNNYLIRTVAGVVFPGLAGDIQVVMTLAFGHDKGLLAFQEELRLGWAVRVGLFKALERRNYDL